VRPRSIALVVMFSMFCILLGVLLALGNFPAGGFQPGDRSAIQSSPTLEGLISVLPEGAGVFLQRFDKQLLFFGGIALFGMLMSGVCIVRAAQFSREKTPKESVRGPSQRSEKVRGIARRWLAIQLPRKGWNLGLTWKIAGTFAAATLLVGVLATGAGYYLIARALRSQASQRAFVIATNLSDGAAGHVLSKDILSLHALLAKFALLEGVAYTFVEDRGGKVLAQSVGNEALYSVMTSKGGEIRDVRHRSVIFRGEAIDETRVPILDGQIGAVHVGIWNSAVEREIRQAIFPLFAWILPILALGVLLAVVLARKIQRPIRQLAQIAAKMSKADLDTPVEVESRDEIGALALSLERMRASLKAAMARLNQQDIRRRA
jgi:HAMP domain-containing protein